MSSLTFNGSTSDLQDTLRTIAPRYPAELIKGQLQGIPRIAFHIDLIRRLINRPNPVIADIGGGIGLFTPGCAALGMEATLVDDFRDKVNMSDAGTRALALHRELGVRIESRDVTAGLQLPHNHFDAITCFDSMEHYHRSPRELFHGLIESLKPGAWFILSVPNCVNLRKRLTVPFGYGKWSPLDSWYGDEAFRGHVREPDVEDLRYIAADLRLKNVHIFGRNWLGYHYQTLRHFLPLVDRLLQVRPSLCANIYLMGSKG